jgi:hypothetical protein
MDAADECQHLMIRIRPARARAASAPGSFWQNLPLNKRTRSLPDNLVGETITVNIKSMPINTRNCANAKGMQGMGKSDQ